MVADPRLLEVLQQNAMLAGLSDVVLRQLLADGSMRSFGINEALIHQGDPARWFAVVIEGRAKLVQLALDGRQALIRYIGPAQEFGIIAVLPDTDYPLSVQAVEPCMAIFWTGETFGQYMRLYAQIGFNALRVMVIRNQEMQHRYQELLTERVDQRLARALLRLAETAGERVESGVLLTIPFTREDLAELTGTTLFSVSRTLSAWEQVGLVETERGRIVVRSLEGLRDFANVPEPMPSCPICGYLRLRKDG
ncbi:MAG: Crp/Fnr family transcriptional regulator [Anaerolineales bacterium]|nr:Crp/Fnr family transcriptional regulator [Anaerolineales bacterium]